MSPGASFRSSSFSSRSCRSIMARRFASASRRFWPSRGPLPEALVLTALAALAFNRTLVAVACLVAASLLHPLMALAGWGVLALVLCFEHRRWAVAVAGLALLVLIGAFAGVPVLHRLVTVMDPDLKAFALSRSPLLFPSQWPIDYLGAICAEAASLIVAASLTQGRARADPSRRHRRRRLWHFGAERLRRFSVAAARRPSPALAHGLAARRARQHGARLRHDRALAAGIQSTNGAGASSARLAVERNARRLRRFRRQRRSPAFFRCPPADHAGLGDRSLDLHRLPSQRS